ncbi:cation:proton antiporter domain-containing protein [Croceicoccus mobilis]|uniref:Potassium transporter TrkA n=1 Tax=Croceicoccus mobilis TaxID=1703339 RepID=A0A916Z5S3_9SPHN|nr:cation:proton antiporter [Croceicoccus mobilis]GGD75999.1 potassium transporter TrkA [Croceicoccus mobilis]
MHATIPYLREILIFLAAAGLIMPVARKMRISPVLGFLCIGFLVGPYGLGRLTSQLPGLSLVVITDIEGVEAIGELGVIFLLFSIGLEMSFQRIWSMRRDVFGLGLSQIMVSAFGIGAAVLWLGGNAESAILLGLCLALSSTAIVMQLLSEQLRLSSSAGKVSFSVLLMQDLAVVPILFLIGLFSGRSDAAFAEAMLALAEAAGVILAIFLAGRFLVRPLLRFVGGSGSQELFMACVLLLIIGTSALTALAGLSMALGAFLAGLLFAATEYRHQVHNDIEPFKGLLLALFFISVGMRLDVVSIWDDIGLILLAALALIVFKAAVLFILARLFRHSRAVSAETAILLGEGGEFALIAVSAATVAAVIPMSIAYFVIPVVVVSMFAAPLLAVIGRRVARILSVREAGSATGSDGETAEGRVIIGGFGRVGRAIGRILEDQQIPYLAIDCDPDLVMRHRNAGIPIHFGNANNDRFLHQIGIEKAIAFISTMDERDGAAAVVEDLHRFHPHLPILARARDPAHARALRNKGAELAIPETTETGLQLTEAVLQASGFPDELARSIIEKERSSSA